MTHPTTNHPDLFPETLLISLEGDQAFTTSLKVAEYFGKRHADILRGIERIINEPKYEFIEESNKRNFALIAEFGSINCVAATYLDARGRTKPMYKLTEEGFAILSMGFTGTKALVWKIKFLNAFLDMERRLGAQKQRESDTLFKLRPPWKPILQHPTRSRRDLIKLTGHKSPGSITACRHRMRQIGLIH